MIFTESIKANIDKKMHHYKEMQLLNIAIQFLHTEEVNMIQYPYSHESPPSSSEKQQDNEMPQSDTEEQSRLQLSGDVHVWH